MKRTLGGLLAAAGLVVLAAACSSSGAGGRAVNITQSDGGCTPVSIPVTPGEKLKLVVTNDSSNDYEIEGIEGTKLEELVVPQGRTRTPGYTVPDGAGVHKVKCYIAGGTSTIIELVAGSTSAQPESDGRSMQPASATGSQKQPDTTVAVELGDYMVTPDTRTVDAGAIRFVVTNASTDAVHEMAVLRVKSPGSFSQMGEVDVLQPGQHGSLTLDLAPGIYRLACLVVKGQEGSTVDHYQQGMHTDITVD
jgi:uncharacterized cupredoxin-like copper-binding protein